MKTSLLTLLSSLFLTSAAFPQGSLTPPGAPAPTMKTLQEAEPRTNLQAEVPAPGVDATTANTHYVINAPGSYYLSRNLAATKPNGIVINAAGVTLDLNGFQISRAEGAGGNGIEIAGASHGTDIRNGSIIGFAIGIYSDANPDRARGCRFRDLAVSGCTFIGIIAGPGAVLQKCRAHDNNSDAGIIASSGSTLIDCTADHNITLHPISAEAGSILTGCTAHENTGANYAIYAGPNSALTNCTAYENWAHEGLYAGAGSTITGCATYENVGPGSSSSGIRGDAACRISHCLSASNTSAGATGPTIGVGFRVGDGGTIENCTATGNRGDGIRLGSDSVARRNNAIGNGEGGNAAGIQAEGSGIRIEGNNVSGNDRGIDVDTAGNFIIRNTAANNGVNWDVKSGNAISVVLAVTAPGFSGNAGGLALGSTDPNANFTH